MLHDILIVVVIKKKLEKQKPLQENVGQELKKKKKHSKSILMNRCCLYRLRSLIVNMYSDSNMSKHNKNSFKKKKKQKQKMKRKSVHITSAVCSLSSNEPMCDAVVSRIRHHRRV